MMQATEDRFHKNERIRRQTMAVFSLRDERMLLRRIRHTRSQCAVRTSAVVMGHPAFENRTQMRFGNRDQPIEAFTAGLSQSRARKWHSPWDSQRVFQHFDTKSPDRSVEVLGEDPVSIVDQVAIPSSIPHDFL